VLSKKSTFSLLPVLPPVILPASIVALVRTTGYEMAAKIKNISVKSKVWLEDRQGRIIFGLGRMRILTAIEKCGSLNAAAKDLKMSYRAVWGKIKVTEEALGKPLLVKSQGGSAGGGSTLTPYARTLMERYLALSRIIDTQADDLFESGFLDPQ
jgi:molybdate transport system regulatory protein